MSLVEFATRRRVTVAMVTLTFVLFGFIALNSLKVILLPDLSYPTLTVPRVALLEDEGEPAVYVVQGKVAKRTTVQLGYTNGEIAEIRSGLKEGDQVVTAGKVAIRDGTEVQVIDAAGGAARALASAAGASR